MGRYTGPVERLSRREGVELFLKGERALNGKSALERRGPVPPGQHGTRRGRRESIYGRQLREKQRAKRYYGVRERQFRRYIRAAARRREGRMGEQLLAMLETRLDNVVYRLGFASTRAQARQFVAHGHVLVDGRRVTIPSYGLRPGQTVTISAGSPVASLAAEATELTSAMPGWLQVDFDKLEGKVVRAPERSEISAPVDEQLIVEFYSRR
jgi:small subunit ribosomal protein S4